MATKKTTKPSAEGETLSTKDNQPAKDLVEKKKSTHDMQAVKQSKTPGFSSDRGMIIL